MSNAKLELPQQILYVLSSESVHQIRQSLQIILDYAENDDNDVVLEQVRALVQTFNTGYNLSGCVH